RASAAITERISLRERPDPGDSRSAGPGRRSTDCVVMMSFEFSGIRNGKQTATVPAEDARGRRQTEALTERRVSGPGRSRSGDGRNGFEIVHVTNPDDHAAALGCLDVPR